MSLDWSDLLMAEGVDVVRRMLLFRQWQRAMQKNCSGESPR